MSPTKKRVNRKARFGAQRPAKGQRATAVRLWVVAGVAMVPALILAGFVFLQSAKPTQAAARVAPDAKTGEAHTFYGAT